MNRKSFFLTRKLQNYLWIVLCLIGVAPSPIFAKHSATIERAAELTPASLCYFIPPQGWEIADPKGLSPRVKIAFVKNTGKGFCPSINLATEETTTSLNDYLKAVKAIHEQDRNNHWRALGKVRTNAGLAQLTEVDSSSQWGPIRILQLIFMKDGSAYVLTAAALKEEFSDYYKEIQSAFRSLTLSFDLVSNIPQLERREIVKQSQQHLIQTAEKILTASTEPVNLFTDPLFQEKHWLPFQQTIINNFCDMGAFWQVLLLRNMHEKLIEIKALNPPDEKSPTIPAKEEIVVESDQDPMIYPDNLKNKGAAQ